MFIKKLKLLITSLFFVLSSFSALMLIVPGHVYADVPAGCSGGPAGSAAPGTICPDGSVPIPDPTLPVHCPGSSAAGPVPTNYSVLCPARPGRAECNYSESTQLCVDTTSATAEDQPIPLKNDCNDTPLNQNNCGIIKYLVLFIKLLSGLVGIVVVAMIIVGGIQYSTSQDDPKATAAAKHRIANAILALIIYFFAFAILQYLIPGGVL